MTSIWDYSAPIGQGDLVGYEVEATDGRIGKIDESSNEIGSAYVVVDTGFWIFGKKRMIPAGVIERVDPDNRTAHVAMSKEQIKSAPDFDATHQDYRDEYERYYGGT